MMTRPIQTLAVLFGVLFGAGDASAQWADPVWVSPMPEIVYWDAPHSAPACVETVHESPCPCDPCGGQGPQFCAPVQPWAPVADPKSMAETSLSLNPSYQVVSTPDGVILFRTDRRKAYIRPHGSEGWQKFDWPEGDQDE